MAEVIEKADAGLLICGHTHKPFIKKIQGKSIINAGSVGKPKHGDPMAAYVVMTFGDKMEAEIRKVGYGFEATAGVIEKSDLPARFMRFR